jgi:hypothetical protein
MKKLGIDSQWRSEQFWKIIFHFSMGIAHGTFISAIPIGFQMASRKTMRRTKTFKGSHRIGEGLIFPKTMAAHSLMTTYQMSRILPGPSR